MFYHSVSYFAGSDTGEIESLRCKKRELEESVTSIEESVRLLQIEKTNIEVKAAEIRKQRVCSRLVGPRHTIPLLVETNESILCRRRS